MDHPGITIERIQDVHIRSTELEIEHVEVLLDPLRVARLRYGNSAQLHYVSEDDLRRGFAVLLAQGYQLGIVQMHHGVAWLRPGTFGGSQGTVRRHGHVVILADLDQFLLV